jgi:hypothetical protein
LKTNIETIKTPQIDFRASLLKKSMVLTLKRFILFKKEDKLYTILISISIIILGTILCNLNEFSPFLLIYIEKSQNNLSLFFRILGSVSFILNFFTFFIIVETIVRILYKRNENTLDFFISFAIVQLPMIFYLLLHLIFKYTELLTINIFNFTDNIVMIIFQVWSLWLLSYSLSVKKELKIENGFIIALLLHMLPFSLILLTFI